MAILGSHTVSHPSFADLHFELATLCCCYLINDPQFRVLSLDICFNTHFPNDVVRFTHTILLYILTDEQSNANARR